MSAENPRVSIAQLLQAGLVALEHFELAAAPGARIAAASLPGLLRSACSLRSVTLHAIACADAALPPPLAGSDCGAGAAVAMTQLRPAGVTATVTLVSGVPASRSKAADADETDTGTMIAMTDVKHNDDASALSWQCRAASEQLSERDERVPVKSVLRSLASGDAAAGPGLASGFGALHTLELAAGDLGDLHGLAALPALQCLKLHALGPYRGAEGAPRAWGTAPRARAVLKSGSPRGAALDRGCLAALTRLERLELHGVRCPDAVRSSLVLKQCVKSFSMRMCLQGYLFSLPTPGLCASLL